MDGGATDPDSIWGEDELPIAQPPSDATLAAIQAAVIHPRFMPNLTAAILRYAHGHRVANLLGFTSGSDLPGGISADDLAVRLLERVLKGKRAWDMQEKPDFLLFCKMHARSMVANLYNSPDAKLRTSLSPLEEENEEGKQSGNAVTNANLDQDRGDRVLGRNEFMTTVNEYLTDFALGLEDDSDEQRIILAVGDDHDSVKVPRDGSFELLAIDRPYMTEKLNISGKAFDAALKRLQRKHNEYLPKWLEKMKITTKEIREMLYGR